MKPKKFKQLTQILEEYLMQQRMILRRIQTYSMRLLQQKHFWILQILSPQKAVMVIFQKMHLPQCQKKIQEHLKEKYHNASQFYPVSGDGI